MSNTCERIFSNIIFLFFITSVVSIAGASLFLIKWSSSKHDAITQNYKDSGYYYTVKYIKDDSNNIDVINQLFLNEHGNWLEARNGKWYDAYSSNVYDLPDSLIYSDHVKYYKDFSEFSNSEDIHTYDCFTDRAGNISDWNTIVIN